jgi:hypothetical protein
MASPRIMPAAGNLGRTGGDILDAQHLESSRLEEPFVLARGNEEIEPDRAPSRELFV